MADRAPYLLRIAWPGAVQETEDPYSFGPLLGELDLHLFNEGRHFELAEALGANAMTIDGVHGVRFAVWAPNAERVAVVGDFNAWDARRHPMRLRHRAGVWELFVPRVAPGARYKYDIVGAGGMRAAAEGRSASRSRPRRRPRTASVVAAARAVPLERRAWMAGRAAAPGAATRRSRSTRCISARGCEPRRRRRGSLWDVAADRLIPYVADMGFTHVELLPITEHPFGGSWGYQPLGLFAPTAPLRPARGLRALRRSRCMPPASA